MSDPNSLIMDLGQKQKLVQVIQDIKSLHLPDVIEIELQRLTFILESSPYYAVVYKAILKFFEVVIQYLVYYLVNKYEKIPFQDGKVLEILLNPKGMSFGQLWVLSTKKKILTIPLACTHIKIGLWNFKKNDKHHLVIFLGIDVLVYQLLIGGSLLNGERPSCIID